MSDRIKHSREEWDRINAERRKAEDEAYAKRKAQGEVASSQTSSELVLPDLDEIRSSQPITPKEIQKVLIWHRELHEPMRMILSRAIRIGGKLRCWHDLIPHGKWLKWCSANLSEINQRTIQYYLQLWENREWLETRPNTKPVSDLPE